MINFSYERYNCFALQYRTPNNEYITIISNSDKNLPQKNNKKNKNDKYFM